MPEGDTIHRAARNLHRALAGETVVRFETVLPRLARVDEDRPIAGRTVEAVSARGKHLLLRFSGDLVLRSHLRMNGSWHLYRPGERWRRPRDAMRVVVETRPWLAVGFDLPVAELLDGRGLARQRDLARLGPDLLAQDFDAREAERRLRARPAREIGEALLDQGALAGVGNELKSEILFIAGVDPYRTVASLTDAALSALVAAARRVLLAAVAPYGAGATTWLGGRRTTGRSNPDERLFVYGRAGEPCRRCGTPIRLGRQGPGARVTYHCPRCQPASGG
ncbi:DNA-formamidopyrimidine glycosylase family protein [Anaeromyxobacter terrae]|uniref:DNA-formamidopyrimidine glycosylase family protein n=1 Tax=Anaeromyxobacter terrae TaxID=2925406 RepID=UPI001F59606F|nr:DNA-formamidopyrimidine glycosylase family protein [Anaeromyxobacter sp. SG22]